MKRRGAAAESGRPRRARLVDDPLWFKDAIFYELRVRSFSDSNADGIGDFPGLSAKLPYLEDLGVTTLWLLPLCPSPGRDDGYDIADYTDVHPELGTLDDFRAFLDEAHARGMRVVTELVLNHTSDQHPWFQRARRAQPGTPERDFYVWSDTPERYRDARIIFKDFEPSNWSWDPVAKAYFWHRFYAHQPDLNFDNPAVRDALFGVVDFWFGLGVDGLRLDAVPYLYERDGTSCENLPETHALLRALRRHVDQRFKNRLLLAEANQWPEEAAAYFGDAAAPECHMNFHFPIMPRIFMSIHMEDRLPILDILEQTPALDEGCQWALFLRNHDELTLEMVTDEERDYMYRAFARESTARINLGIRRRLAPLLGNNRRNIELTNALLFSLPGTPVLYYGDEIAMGDNIYLGDRNGVRTPMQWSADKNAGFSRANPQRLVLPVIIDPEYHFESVNVEAQQQNPNSLLWWMKRLIALRKRFSAFGRGTIELLSPENPRVLAFIRRYREERVLVVANLSRRVQYVELDLRRYQGQVPVELFGGTRFPAIGELPYLLTLGEHAFYWFSLEESLPRVEEAREAAYVAPVMEVGPAGIFDPSERAALEQTLRGYVERRRWYPRRERGMARLQVLDVVELHGGDPRCPLPIVVVQAEAHYGIGESERFFLPLCIATAAMAQSIRARAPQAIVAQLERGAGEGSATLVDALADPQAAAGILGAMRDQHRTEGEVGTLSTVWIAPRVGVDDAAEEPAEAIEPHLLRSEHRQAAIVYGARYVLKFLRHADEGRSPELEVGHFLARRGELGPAAPVAALAGAIEYRSGRSEPVTMAVLLRHVANEGSAWSLVRAEMLRAYEVALSLGRDRTPTTQGRVSLLDWSEREPGPLEREVMGGTLAPAARLIGQRTGELHLALTSAQDDAAFVPESWSGLDQRSLYQSLRNLAGKVLRLLQQRLPMLATQPQRARLTDLARRFLDAQPALFRRFEPLRERRFTMARTRIHGHHHLESILYTGKDFVVLGFGGDPARSLSERRRKRLALEDVATLVRSIACASSSALGDEVGVRQEDRAMLEPWARVIRDWTAASLLGAWLRTVRGAGLIPEQRANLATLLDALLIEKALDDVGRELDTRSERAETALADLVDMLTPQ